MPAKNAVSRILLVVYAVGSVAIVIPLLLDLPRAGELAGTTSGKILAAAILALALGAALAARDPFANRVVILVLIAFMTLAALAILWHLLSHRELSDVGPTWMVLLASVAGPALMAVFYPRRSDA